MGLEHLALAVTNNLPIRHEGKVHNGKVRSVYWLSQEDSARLIKERNYDIHPDSLLAIMVISDRISAFECNWKAEDGLHGIPLKGAGLNAVSHKWFKDFDRAGLAGNHILEVPHPLMWVVQKTEPVMAEGIVRAYITGSMWRAYEKGSRDFCGNKLSGGLKKNQKLDNLLLTPTTKGVLKGIPGVPEEDDVDITREQIVANYDAFGFKAKKDIDQFDKMLLEGFDIISTGLKPIKKIFVDTKFEVGYIRDTNGTWIMVYQDEVGTPDSSRMWDEEKYAEDIIVEESKEGFRQYLINLPTEDAKEWVRKGTLNGDINEDQKEALLEFFEDHTCKELMTEKQYFGLRKNFAAAYRVPVEVFQDVSATYTGIAEKIIDGKIPEIKNAQEEIAKVIKDYGLLQ